MKRFFETPEVNAVEVESMDLIMASKELVKANDSKLLGIKDDTAAAAGLWEGAGNGWL